MLTDREIKGFKADTKQYKRYDSDGLFLLVTPAGGKLWRYRYKYDNKDCTIALGKYPKVSLYEARQKRDECARTLERGLNPNISIGKRDAVLDFRAVALEWASKKSWTSGTRLRNERILLEDLAVSLAGKEFSEIKTVDLRHCVDAIEKRGALDVAKRSVGMASEIFCYGIGRGYCEFDIASPLKVGRVSRKNVPHSALIDPVGIRRLMTAIKGYSPFIVRHYLLLQAYTFMRPSEGRKLRWSEVNFEDRRIELSADRMGKNGLPFIVPMSDQVFQLLTEMRVVTGQYQHVFISKSQLPKDAPISDATALKSLRIMGFGANEQSVHGFRSIASTVLNEAVNEDGYTMFNADWIERQLAHVSGAKNSKVRADTKHGCMLRERTRMMQWYADYLDSLTGDFKR